MNYIVLTLPSQLRVVMCHAHLENRENVARFQGTTNEPCYLCNPEWYQLFKEKLVRQVWLKEINQDHIVYISGPMSGYEDHNKPAFWVMECLLKQTGCKVLSPAHHPDGQTHEWYMRHDISWLCDSTHAVFLDGWVHSMGALTEYAVAEVIKLPIFYEQ